MNSSIRTATGLALVINNKPYAVESSHPNYTEILDALRVKRWDDIPELIDVANKLKPWVDKQSDGTTDLQVDVAGGVILFRDTVVRGVISARILDMYADGFDISPMAKFLANLYENPSNRAVEELYGWMESNGITITEDGYLLAFKRVNNDYTSFFDNTTKNNIGLTPELPRNMVDDRSEVTCSHGLHFCSQAYLPHYAGGQGKVLLLKIHPRDVVSIPNDYNNAKGRACKYEVIDELKGDARRGIETHNVIPQSVVTAKTDYNTDDGFKAGYQAGYRDGRGKKVVGASFDSTYGMSSPNAEDLFVRYGAGYDAGRTDGRNKQPKLY